MRHTAQPLTAGDWHGFPVLFERALQRKARCMARFEEEGSVVAVIGDLYGTLAAAHHGIRDDGLVGVHGDVLHRDLLLAFAAMAVERLGKPRERSRGLVGECQVPCAGLEALSRDPGPPVEVKRGGVRGDHLGAQHAFYRVLGIDTDLASQSAERTLHGRRRHRTVGLRERARQLRRQVLVPLVMLAPTESAELSYPSVGVYGELGHARGDTSLLVW